MSENKYRVIIVGAGGFGREIHSWISLDPQSVKLNAPWYFGGFLDANPDALKNFDPELPILGDPSTFAITDKDVLICAIGDPVTKLRLCHELLVRNARFVSLISSDAVVGLRCKLGQGCVVLASSKLTADITFGDFVSLNVVVTVGHDVIIGDGCTVSPHSVITGNVRLGEGVFVASQATIAPGVVVGDYARVGAGSAVIRKVPPYTTVMGVPAKTIFTRSPKLESYPK